MQKLEQEQKAPPQSEQRAGPRPWVVLVGGEHWKLVKENKPMGLHCSVEWVARAYAELVDVVGRDRIITIVSLREVIEWLEAAAASGEPLFSPNITAEESRRRWGAKLAEVRHSCARLLSDGGADYDGDRVHAATLTRVLSGTPEREGDRVVPAHAGGGQDTGSCVFLAVYSHGWSHELAVVGSEHAKRLEAKYPCDLCGQPHDPDRKANHEHSSWETREWFVHFPHDTPESERDMYNFTVLEDIENPNSRLFAQHFFQCFHHMVQRLPDRPIVAFLNFCGSGGFLKFLERPAYRRHYEVDQWPVCMMCAAGEMEGAIPDLFPLWFANLRKALTSPSGRSTTLRQLFDSTLEEYYRRNSVLLSQVYHVSHPCLLCNEYQGKPETLHLCSACHKKYTALGEAERPPLEPVSPTSVPPEVDPTRQRPRLAGNPAVCDAPLSRLFL